MKWGADLDLVLALWDKTKLKASAAFPVFCTQTVVILPHASQVWSWSVMPIYTLGMVYPLYISSNATTLFCYCTVANLKAVWEKCQVSFNTCQGWICIWQCLSWKAYTSVLTAHHLPQDAYNFLKGYLIAKVKSMCIETIRPSGKYMEEINYLVAKYGSKFIFQ